MTRHLDRHLKRYARTMRSDSTIAERVLWQRLRARQLHGFKFRRQHVVGPYILDFFCAAAGLAVELDGDQHGWDERAASDRERTAWLAERGVRVLRFSNRDVGENLGGVLETIAAALEE